MDDTSIKHSATHTKERIEQFEAGLDKKQKKPKNGVAKPLPSRVDVPCQLCGGALLLLLTEKNNCTAIVDAECAKRGITKSKAWKEKASRKKKKFTIAEKRALLRKDERAVLLRDMNIIMEKETDVKHIIPQSDELKAFLPVQKKKRILQDELRLDVDKEDASTDP
jgi:hypothetical protein